ncbi:Metallophosphoesterase domain-containing protein [Lachnellula willkommii]|uniref:Metallophosphoesterase domain-containing protein n=1 Tax=Lachnellula willkommii TaxID=215461 RepID=A0A559LZT5_9HELO|nr:Metallophosphoesterase domain-containing protein [Lachnellula willkommii]
MASTVSTRFMIISDTHGFQFGDAEKAGGHFKHPLPQCDVLLHCGDLTHVGRPSELEDCLRMLKSIHAELKLVIAGNHERPLDMNWVIKHNEKKNDPNSPPFLERKRALDILTGPLAKEAGVTYLTEGLNTFTLKNGAKFTVYSSPYTPAFCDWAFPYGRLEDRFNPADKVDYGFKCITEKPIPDFPRVDIVMTHGPPRYVLDRGWNGNVGCASLFRAISRARPRLHCFGHIHEAYGAKLIQWSEDKESTGSSAMAHVSEGTNSYPQESRYPVIFGKETLMVNAAIMDSIYRPVNAPWLVDVDLPKAASD